MEKALGLDERQMILMAESIAIERRIADAPSLAIGGRFKGFGPEKESAVGKADVRENRAIQRFKEIWRKSIFEFPMVEEFYLSMLESVKGLRYSSRDVEEFSVALAEFQEEYLFSEKAGLFLSALINNGDEQDYTINTQHLAVLPDNLGCKNVKNIKVKGDVGHIVGELMREGSIIVQGDAGSDVGRMMEGGSIIVEGNVWYETGSQMKGGSIVVCGDADYIIGYCMRGGSITVEGNAGSGVGHGMKAGSIVIKGSAGSLVGLAMEGGDIVVGGDALDDVGKRMEGGSIILEGDCEGISDNIKGGRIYHRGKLIFPK